MVSGGKKFSEKHGRDATPHPAIAEAVRNRAKDATVACAVAFDIAAELDKPPLEVGRTVDLMEYRLVKCQMGLFGYGDKGKIVSADESVSESLTAAIGAAAPEGRLTCRSAWDIAARLDVPKLRVGSACEALGIKIKPCQLGAF